VLTVEQKHKRTNGIACIIVETTVPVEDEVKHHHRAGERNEALQQTREARKQTSRYLKAQAGGGLDGGDRRGMHV
jgi:hypothetical protein